MSELDTFLYSPYKSPSVEPVTSPLPPLSVSGKSIQDSEGPIVLKGICATTHNREDFIYGFPGTHTELMKNFYEVSPQKARVFDESLRFHSFQEEDARFIASCGANAVRWSLNYRYFTDDQNPDFWNEKSFNELDQIISLLGKYGVYTVLDFHAAPGGQNPDWHSDNATGTADFWNYRILRDWQVKIVGEFAKRYQGNHNIAAFDLLNEPQTLTSNRDYRYDLLNQYYVDAVEAVRNADPDRICIIEGDGFSSRCKDKDGQGEVKLIEPFTSNLVYSLHPYYPAALGRGKYPGEIEESYYTGEVKKHYWDKEKYAEVFHNQQMVKFARESNVPLFAGEYGAAFIYTGEEPYRLQALLDQIEVFNEYGDSEDHPVHRTLWEAKDTGDSGLIRINPESSYSQFIEPFQELKDELKLEWWKRTTLKPGEIDEKLTELTDYFGKKMQINANDLGKVNSEIAHRLLAEFAAHRLQTDFVAGLDKMSAEEIDDLVSSSWGIENCLINNGIYTIFSADCKEK